MTYSLKKINKVLRELEQAERIFAPDHAWWCCQSCGCAGLPEGVTRYAFYHE